MAKRLLSEGEPLQDGDTVVFINGVRRFHREEDSTVNSCLKCWQGQHNYCEGPPCTCTICKEARQKDVEKAAKQGFNTLHTDADTEARMRPPYE